MMMFEDMGFCGDLDFFASAPIKGVDVCPLQSAEPEPEPKPDQVVEDDYTDEEIDLDELEKRLWRDKMRLKRLKEMNKGKECVHVAKPRQSQEQARRKKMSRAEDEILKYMLKMMEVCKAKGFVDGIIPEKGKQLEEMMLKEMNKRQECVDVAKQQQSQEQARRKKMPCPSCVDVAKQQQSQEQARRKKMSIHRSRQGGRRCHGHKMLY